MDRILYACLALIMTGGAEARPHVPTPSSYEEVEVSSGELRGSLLSVAADAPLVLIIPGSGPTDRDGNSPNGLNTDAYKLLAQGLFDHGISTVRVDKRGMFASVGAGNPNAVTVEQYASDYGGWVDTLLGYGSNACIFLLGHSEGGVIAMRTAIDRDDICGLVLLAAPGRSLDEILVEQLSANPANLPILDEALSAIASLKKGETLDTTGFHPALAQLFHRDVQGFLISMMSIDPVELLRRADLPTLVVQGGNDLQVSENDANLLMSVNDAELVLIPEMNHVLKDATNDQASNIATYSNPDLPISDGLVEEIASFILD